MRTGFPFTGTQHALGHWLSKPQAGICPFILPCIYNLAQLCRAQPAQPYSVALTPNTWRLSHQGPGQEEASEGRLGAGETTYRKACGRSQAQPPHQCGRCGRCGQGGVSSHSYCKLLGTTTLSLSSSSGSEVGRTRWDGRLREIPESQKAPGSCACTLPVSPSASFGQETEGDGGSMTANSKRQEIT
jgi:hypothetical protein